MVFCGKDNSEFRFRLGKFQLCIGHERAWHCEQLDREIGGQERDLNYPHSHRDFNIIYTGPSESGRKRLGGLWTHSCYECSE